MLKCPHFRVRTGYKPTQTLMKKKKQKKKQIKKTNKKLEKRKKKKIEQRTTNHGLPGVHLP